MSIGENIAKLRLKRGRTDDELSIKLHLIGCYMTRELLANIERGRYAVTDSQIVYFSEVLALPINDLLSPVKPTASKNARS
jgi:transcriptional regulator with XRE-family HTH domain